MRLPRTIRPSALTSLAIAVLGAGGCSDDGSTTSTSSSTSTSVTVTGTGGASQGSGGATNVGGAGSSVGGAGQGGGSAGGPTPCGSTFCAVDETCVSGACTYPCTGANVPGDYASVSAAVEALETVGGTICVGAGTWSDPIGAAPSANMEIVGTSSDAVITGPVTLGPVQGAKLRLAHLRVEEEVFVGTYSAAGLEGDVTIEACTISSPDGEWAIQTIASFQGKKVLIDRCDLSTGGSSGALNVGVTLTGGTHDVTVRNSYIHDSLLGVWLVNLSNAANVVTFVNDTFVDDGTAIRLSAPAGSLLTLRYANDVFTGSTTALELFTQPGTTVLHSANALFGNTTNYAGSAVAGAGYVTTDLMLDGMSPPAPLAGSPLVGAADAAPSPSADFWGATRDASPDIGAVEAP